MKVKKNVYLQLELPFGRSLHWHGNAVDARRELLETAHRMGCRLQGNGTVGVLVRPTGATAAEYEIGVDQ